jgi:hypothetical protein
VAKDIVGGGCVDPGGNMKARITTPWAGTGENHPLFGDVFAVQSWNDVTGQDAINLAIDRPMYTIEAICTAAQLAAITADFRFAVIWSGQDEDEIGGSVVVSTVKAQLTAAGYNQDVADLVTTNTTAAQVVDENLRQAQLQNVWGMGKAFTVGQVVNYSNNLWQCIQAHTATDYAWRPGNAWSLWKRYYTDGAPWPWVQPQGAHDAYPLGAKVTYGGYTWQSDISANVWHPGVYGWTNLTPPPPTPAWAYPVAYKINDLVTYGGNTYKCRQAHTSQAAWTPPAVPALWLKL